MENRELLDKVKRWEDSELSTQNIENKDLIVQKKLAPLNEGGPMQLLKAQVRLIFIPNSMENQVFPLKLVFWIFSCFTFKFCFISDWTIERRKYQTSTKAKRIGD